MTTSLTKTIKDNYKTGRVIELRNVGKKYPLSKLWALKDISLDVHKGEILGIIGRNGAGKSTLLNVIAGITSATTGEVCLREKVLGLFNLGVGFQDELTGRENIFLNGALMGTVKSELENKLSSIIEFSELGSFIDMPLGTYSQGMRLRLGFSVVINLDFEILVIDEVLAVGDMLFQHKCFERLMDFRRAGKTLVITNQSMDLVKRLCDKVALLGHGQLLFHGDTIEGINKYLALLNTEKFFVGSLKQDAGLVENTKKWADDTSNWGKILGTKEVVIDKVKLINNLGLNCSRAMSGKRLKIKVYFTARNSVKEPHFGVAIFRNDGVYCYGPNTEFDGYKIPELRQGKGYFVLNFPQLLLAPGEYRVSVAIWDKFETLAFDYHKGCYKLTIYGNQGSANELFNIPFKFYPRNYKNFKKCKIDLGILNDKWGEKIETESVEIESIRLLNNLGEEKVAFMTNEPADLIINFSKLLNRDNNSYLWLGIFRDDGIFCQSITQPLVRSNIFKISFPRLSLLPGGYLFSLGIWDRKEQKFKMYHHAAYPFRMIFNRQDHGTIYLKHIWSWRLPLMK